MEPNRKPEVMELDADQLEAQLQQIEQTMGEATARPFRQLLGWYLSLLKLIDQKNTTISRLRRLLFGARTERSRHLEQSSANNTAAAADPSSDEGSALNPSASPTGAG
jgi:hypothetical protein